MKGNKLLKSKNIEELSEFFDNNDMGSYLENCPEVNFDIDIKHRKYLFSVNEELLPKLNKIAHQKHISLTELLNSWVREKVYSKTV